MYIINTRRLKIKREMLKMTGDTLKCKKKIFIKIQNKILLKETLKMKQSEASPTNITASPFSPSL